MKILEPRSGTALELKKGKKIKIIDIEGEQVSDFFCVASDDISETFSAGRTIDYSSCVYVKKGSVLYSSKSRPLVRIIEDTVNRHDILLTPCSKETFEIIYGDHKPHHGCEGNLCRAFSQYGIELSSLPATFNIFMNVDLAASGKITVMPPLSRPGDFVVLEAIEDLIVGVTACSALQSNNGSFKPIGYELL